MGGGDNVLPWSSAGHGAGGGPGGPGGGWLRCSGASGRRARRAGGRGLRGPSGRRRRRSTRTTAGWGPAAGGGRHGTALRKRQCRTPEPTHPHHQHPDTREPRHPRRQAPSARRRPPRRLHRGRHVLRATTSLAGASTEHALRRAHSQSDALRQAASPGATGPPGVPRGAPGLPAPSPGRPREGRRYPRPARTCAGRRRGDGRGPAVCGGYGAVTVRSPRLGAAKPSRSARVRPVSAATSAVSSAPQSMPRSR